MIDSREIQTPIVRDRKDSVERIQISEDRITAGSTPTVGAPRPTNASRGMGEAVGKDQAKKPRYG
jgi:hypothetical protein